MRISRIPPPTLLKSPGLPISMRRTRPTMRATALASLRRCSQLENFRLAHLDHAGFNVVYWLQNVKHRAGAAQGGQRDLGLPDDLVRTSFLRRARVPRSSDHLALAHVFDLGGRAAEPLAIDRLAIRAEDRGAFQRHLGVRHA